MLLWLDIETTGLDPQLDSILEVGLIATLDDLEEVWRASSVCSYDLLGSHYRQVHPRVVEMHKSSGLWNECADAIKSASDTEDSLLRFLHSQFGADDGAKKFPMCGSTVGFDRSFLKAQMPRLHDFFHYRSINVSTLTELARVWYPDVYANRPGADESQRPHRALQDLEGSIALLRYYRRTMMHDAATATAKIEVPW